jgi:hypothetical protein
VSVWYSTEPNTYGDAKAHGTFHAERWKDGHHPFAQADQVHAVEGKELSQATAMRQQGKL